MAARSDKRASDCTGSAVTHVKHIGESPHVVQSREEVETIVTDSAQFSLSAMTGGRETAIACCADGSDPIAQCPESLVPNVTDSSDPICAVSVVTHPCQITSNAIGGPAPHEDRGRLF